MQDIIEAKSPVTDPRGVPSAIRWDVQGKVNGRNGAYVLVVDSRTNTVLHFYLRVGSGDVRPMRHYLHYM